MNSDQLDKLRIQSSDRRRPWGGIFAIFAAVILLTGVALFFAWPRDSDGRRTFGKTRAAATNSTASATTAPAQNTNGLLFTVSGYIINRERIELSPRFLGVVKWIGVKKGDAVTNGQVVVLLDDAEQKARLAEAESRVASARVTVSKTELDYERIRKLIAANIESKQNEDDFRLRVESAKASLKEADAHLELNKTYHDWTVIRSPINGVVMEKLAVAGALVTPQSFGGTRGPSTAVLAVADPKDLQVEIDLNEEYVGKVYLQQPCRVSPEAYPKKIYTGYVAEMAPEANRQKGTLQIKVQIRDPDQFLKPELSAKVDFLAKP
ncbi:MAG: efflux RND transporter periplasmic adaptor subunit [Pedosphaera sp.]|nr:efflux RND transporter periplasmic adaptor subunit [Pedosphaera sp.]